MDMAYDNDDCFLKVWIKRIKYWSIDSSEDTDGKVKVKWKMNTDCDYNLFYLFVLDRSSL